MRWPRLPFRSTRAVTRRLRRRADAARDAQQWPAAAILYEEALALGGENGPLHVQCGHMWKEAGDLRRAERHYEAATALLPDDADLALQLGHFHKAAGQPARAEAAYARALRLSPGWEEATRELGLLAGSAAGEAAIIGATPILPELLPAVDAAPAQEREGMVVRQLGRELAQAPGGVRRVLRGVQAIRGWCVSAQPLAAVTLLVDGAVLLRHPLGPAAGRAGKHVFNLWHDFSAHPPGEVRVELQATDAHGRVVAAHRAILLVLPPSDDPARLASDAFVPLPPGTGDLAGRIAQLPSMVRPAARRLLATPPRAVLVQRVDQLGDLACSVPAIRRLRALFGEARLVGLVSPANAGLAHALELFDEVLLADFPERNGRRGMTAEAQRALGETLARYRFDVGVDLSEGADSRPLLLLSGARLLVGFGPRQFPWLGLGIDLATPDPLDRLETMPHGRKLQALVEALALAHAGGAAVVPPSDPARYAALRAEQGFSPGRRYILLHTGARLAFSRWPGFAALATLLLRNTDLAIVLMRDDEEEDDAFPADPRLAVIAGRLPFERFDALVAGAALFVGNDSGPKHLAALRGTPVVSLHMARLNWSEWGQEQTGAIVSRRVPCAGCGIALHPEECGRAFACIRGIGPEEVLAAVLSRLPG